jgi:hypothetical protein
MEKLQIDQDEADKVNTVTHWIDLFDDTVAILNSIVFRKTWVAQ